MECVSIHIHIVSAGKPHMNIYTSDLLQGLPSSRYQADHPAAGTVQCHTFHAGYVSLTVTHLYTKEEETVDNPSPL